MGHVNPLASKPTPPTNNNLYHLLLLAHWGLLCAQGVAAELVRRRVDVTVATFELISVSAKFKSTLEVLC